jgi:hypothetical protein
MAMARMAYHPGLIQISAAAMQAFIWAGCRPHPSATGRCLLAQGSVERGQHALLQDLQGL